MRQRALVFAIFLFAVFVRIGFTIAFRGSLDVVPIRSIAGADGVEYDQFARSMSEGKGYCWPDGRPTSFRAPGFPLVLTVLYSLISDSYQSAYILFAVCGGLTCVSAYLLGKELVGETEGRAAAILAALYPGDVFACSYFFSEVVFAPCLGFGLWLLARSVRLGSLWAVTGAGLLLGFAALTRSFAILLLPIFGLYLIGLPPTRRGLLVSLVFGVGFLAVIAPWTYRNIRVHHQFVLIATNGGSTFYGANNPLVASTPRQYGNWVSTTELPGRDLIDAQPDEVSHDKMEWKLGIDWVKENPEKFAFLGAFKVIRFWLPFVQWPSLKTYPIVNIVTTTPFLVLILAGLMYTLANYRRHQSLAILHLTMLANLVMLVIFWGDPRFRDANVPVLMVYAAIGGTRAANYFSQRKSMAGAESGAIANSGKGASVPASLPAT